MCHVCLDVYKKHSLFCIKRLKKTDSLDDMIKRKEREEVGDSHRKSSSVKAVIVHLQDYCLSTDLYYETDTKRCFSKEEL